jgi:hypothetical protein
MEDIGRQNTALTVGSTWTSSRDLLGVGPIVMTISLGVGVGCGLRREKSKIKELVIE